MNDWGEDGPIIGPVNVSWTYGELKVHCPDGDGDDFEFLPIADDLIFYNSMGYGDMHFYSENDDFIKNNKENIHNYKTFQSNLKLK
jgi:hypothetical protein